MNREKSQVFEGVLSVIVNFLLFALKFSAGLISGSVALMADAWHTMSDSLSSVIVVATAKLASRKPDKEHPYGHGRWELIASLLISFILGMIGYEFLSNSINRFQNRESVVYGNLAFIVTVVSIIAKELSAQYAFYLGRKHSNPVVSADGWHHRTDALSSVVILVGIIMVRFIEDLWWMDSVLGSICALMIFFAAIKIMKEAVTKILGEEPDNDLIKELSAEVAKSYDNSLEIHHIHLHNYISQKEITLHIMLDGDMTIVDGHKIATIIENMIKEKFDMEATIHIEPLNSQ